MSTETKRKTSDASDGHCRSTLDRNIYEALMEIEIDTDHLIPQPIGLGE